MAALPVYGAAVTGESNRLGGELAYPTAEALPAPTEPSRRLLNTAGRITAFGAARGQGGRRRMITHSDDALERLRAAVQRLRARGISIQAPALDRASSPEETASENRPSRHWQEAAESRGQIESEEGHE
jgi:hypothetical protein